MIQRCVAPLVLVCGLAFSQQPAAAQGRWSFSLYGGPTTDTITTQIASGHLHLIGGMVGFAVDHKLAYLGSGFSLGAEGQVTQYLTHDSYQTVSLGLGVSYNNFPWTLPTTLAVYLGPSYAFDPPPLAGKEHPLLNYVSAEFAIQVPNMDKLDAVLRLYHRSGAWGLYARNVDQGTMVGMGLRYRF
ncbi:MAG: hypothetical protein ACJ8IR_13275 [Alphaproteobacteria bacterium]|jgi:hypothetical protein